MNLLEISDPDSRRARTAHWRIDSIDEAYVNAEHKLLVCFTGRAPRTARRKPYSMLISLDTIPGSLPHPPLRKNAGPIDPDSPVRATRAHPAAVQAPTRQPDRVIVGPREIYAGRPAADALAQQGWTRVPVRPAPPCDPACGRRCRTRDPPAEHAGPGTLYVAVCDGASADFEFAAAGVIPVAVQTEPFRYPGPSLYALRIFLPVTVAFDAVTSPIQGIMLLYVLHNMSWF